MLQNRMPKETLEELRTRVRKPKVTDRSPEEEAATKVYADKDGRFGVPAKMLHSCVVEAGRRVKNGKSQISTAETTTVPSFLTIREFFLPFTNGAKWVVDEQRGCNPKDGVAVCLVRPRFDEWEFDVTLDVDETTISEATVRQLFNVAGSMCGLGDYRPNKKGPYGRFTVTKWEVVNGKSAGA